MRHLAQHTRTLAVILSALGAASAHGETVQDLVTIRGESETRVQGLGIVVGLAGTGDTSRDSYVAARPYRELLANLDNPVGTLDELEEADAYALVLVTATIPAAGATVGSQIDVRVDKVFNATSLAGGRLVTSLLYLPVKGEERPLVAASGSLALEGEDQVSAVVRDGGQMLQDVGLENLVNETGHLWLVLDEPFRRYPIVQMLASVINENMAGADAFGAVTDQVIAVAENRTFVRVRVPEADRGAPVPFIARLLEIKLDHSLIRLSGQILVDREAGLVVALGNVQVRPVAISHRNLALTPVMGDPNLPPAGADADPPSAFWAALDTTDGSGRESAQLNDLIAALKQLNVPVEDQIEIVYGLQHVGAITAEIIESP